MSKKLTVIIALIVTALFLMSGCNGADKFSVSLDASGSSTNNGGFVAETKDYVYFINGIDVSDADNTFGEVEKGALVRAKKEEIKANAKLLNESLTKPEKSTFDNVKVETVVPKLIISSDYTSGLYIFDDYIYYATPYSTKDKVGNIDKTKLDFMKTKLDGTDAKVIATASGNSTIYRFVKSGEKVYLYFVGTGEDSNTEITVYDCSTAKQIFKAEGAKTYVIDKNLDGEVFYYTKEVKDDSKENATEKFNSVYSYKLGDETEKEILFGAGSNNDTQEKSYAGKGQQGVTFTLIASQNGYLYLSWTFVDTTTPVTKYCALKYSDVTADAEENYKKLTVLYDAITGDTEASAIFVATSYYVDINNIIFLNTTDGLYSYDYTKNTDYDNNYGKIRLYKDSVIITATVNYIKGDYIYYNVSGVFYRLKLNGAAATDSEPQKLSALTLSTTWYAPEVVTIDSKDYLFAVVSGEPYYDYVSVMELTEKGDDKLTEVEDEPTFFEYEVATEEENVEFNLSRRLGIITDEDKESVTKYIDSTFNSDSDSSTSTSDSSDEGCGSAVATGSVVGLLMMLCGAVALKKKN